MEDDQHQAMLPQIGDDHASASAAGSMAALHRLVHGASDRGGGCDTDTDHSSASPSSRSTHSTGLLHTFHPYPTSSQQHLDHQGVEPCTSATELLQAYPTHTPATMMAHTFPQSGSNSPPRGGMQHDVRSRNVPHAPRPPEVPRGQGGFLLEK